jgi:4-hydroxy-tetrahydrodipicolinate reductase
METIRVGIIGARGQMGQALRQGIQTSKIWVLTGAVIKDSDSAVGQLLDELPSLAFTSHLESVCPHCDVLLDFSVPQAVLQSLEIAQHFRTPFVCGVTGLSSSVYDAFSEAARTSPVFYAANMSWSMAVMAKAVEFLSQALDENMDVEINEMHHSRKTDAPSGTALHLGKAVAKAKGWAPEDVFCFQREGKIGVRPQHQIGFSIIRGGDLPGTRTVYFLGPKETLSISHQSLSRSLFASGALKAAQWTCQQKPGLYSMQDLLDSLL